MSKETRKSSRSLIASIKQLRIDFVLNISESFSNDFKAIVYNILHGITGIMYMF